MKIKLNTKLISLLQTLPETGMGYQIINIGFRNGRVVKEVKILNCTYALISENMNFRDIKSIEVMKNGKIIGQVDIKYPQEDKEIHLNH